MNTSMIGGCILDVKKSDILNAPSRLELGGVHTQPVGSLKNAVNMLGRARVWLIQIVTLIIVALILVIVYRVHLVIVNVLIMLKNGNAVKKQMGTDYGMRVKPVKVMIAKKIAQMMNPNVVPTTPAHCVFPVKMGVVYQNVKNQLIAQIINVACLGVVKIAMMNASKICSVLANNAVRMVHAHTIVQTAKTMMSVPENKNVKMAYVLTHQNQPTVKMIVAVHKQNVVKTVNVFLVTHQDQEMMGVWVMEIAKIVKMEQRCVVLLMMGEIYVGLVIL